ncbi:MAG: MBL fold metallo-hydrolase [Clostridia bacterium]|nr:MBL fold metallo-hydrolase [Clostridia bacterium]
MNVKWLGRACFLLESAEGLLILTDPFDQTVGYPLPNITVDVVTVSHQHFDHNAVGLLPGHPVVVEGDGDHTVKGVTFQGIATYHDNEQGALRGPNTVFVFEVDGIRVCHLGDLGHTLSEKQVAMIGQVDLLLIPVGGTYTIDGDEAFQTVSDLKPRTVVPMHFKANERETRISGDEPFTRHFPDVQRADGLILDRNASSDRTNVVVLKPGL